MKITRNSLSQAVTKQIITEDQAKNLMDFLKTLAKQSPDFNMMNVLYYLGGIIAISAMTLFMNLSWDIYNGWGLVVLSSCYAVLALTLTHQFDQKGYLIPAGICATLTICLAPIAIYGLQLAIGWWPKNSFYHDFYHFNVHWLVLEFGTLFVAIFLACIYRYPFMIMPIAVSLWYISLELVSLLSGEGFNFELNALISVYFGLVIIAIAFAVDVWLSHTIDYAFWLYIVGVMLFWGGVSSQHATGEFSQFLYMVTNAILIFTGVLLNRKIFVIFGSLGLSYYLAHLAFQVYKFSYLFPLLLSMLGFAIIYLGIFWQKNERFLTKKIRATLPKALQERFQEMNDKNNAL